MALKLFWSLFLLAHAVHVLNFMSITNAFIIGFLHIFLCNFGYIWGEFHCCFELKCVI